MMPMGRGGPPMGGGGMGGGGDDEAAMKQQLLEELMQLARGGQARELAARLGKGPGVGALDPGAADPLAPPDDGSAPMEGDPAEEGAETPEQEDAESIPGAEPDGLDGEAPAAAGGKVDPMKLKMLLEKMKAQKGG